MLELGTKVQVHHETHPFTGEIEMAIKWENPLSAFHKKGIDYVVRADDDKKLYKCPEKDVSQIKAVFTCQGCNHELPKGYQLKTEGFCFLCDPNISVDQLLAEF